MRRLWRKKFQQHWNNYARIYQVRRYLHQSHLFSCVYLFLYVHVTVELRLYFEHVRSLGFEDRPDYDYLKRLFRELFFRKGFTYDNVYDWDVLSQANASTASANAYAMATSGALASNNAGTTAVLPPIGSYNQPQGELQNRSSILNQFSSELVGSRVLDNSQSVLVDKSGMSFSN